jgi:microcystin-dependent protein
MPDITQKLKLRKPLGNETVCRAAYNENLDILDNNSASQEDFDSFKIAVVAHNHKERSSGIGALIYGVPTGTILDFAGTEAPDGFLICSGQAVFRTTYVELFKVIGITFGPGDGYTTFNLPDTPGRTIVGAGQGSGLTQRNTGDKPGAESHTLKINEVPSHAHSGGTGWQSADHCHGGTTGTDYPDHYHSFVGAFSDYGPYIDLDKEPSGSNGRSFSTGGASARHQHSFQSGGVSANHYHGITAEGGGQAHNNMQPSLVMNKIIKY